MSELKLAKTRLVSCPKTS